MSSNCKEIETRIQEAIQHVKKNPRAKRAKVARDFNVPIGRLRSRLENKPSASSIRGIHRRRLTPEQDLTLELYLRQLIKLGLHPRLRLVERAANKLLLQDCDQSNPPPPLSHAWSKRWMDRFPDFQKVKRKPLAAVRKNAEDPEVIERYFDQFIQQVREHGICEEDVWNFDETGFRMGIARSDWVITSISENDKHSIRSKDPDNRESLTSIESINGAGGSIPSFLILTGMMIMNSWSNNDLNEDVVLSTAETGYSNDWLSLKWLKHFDTHTIKTRKGTYRLLLMDGYGSHHTIEFIEYCNEAKIIPFGLPAHTTHLLQPLDVVVFQPLKYWHSEAVKEAMAQGDETFTKVEFLNAFNSFRKKTFKRSTVLSAWRQVGLIPFNPSIVLDKLPKRKLFSEFSSPPRHPDEAYEAAFSTPRNFQELKEASYNIESVYPDAMNLHKFMKGALAVARKDELIVDQLAHTKAAENARRIRANQTKRVIQKGGVIRVEDCRKMTSERMEEENRLETTRQNKLILNQRKRWGPVMRELTRKTPYYIQGGSYAFSCK